MKKSLAGVTTTALTIALLVACGDDDRDLPHGEHKDSGSAGGTAGAPPSNDAATNSDGPQSDDASVDRPFYTDAGAAPDAMDVQDATSDILDASSDGGPISDASNESDANAIPDSGSDISDASSADADTSDGCPGDNMPPTTNPDAAAGPVYPIPAGLWQPPGSFVPPGSTYVYLKGDNGDYIVGERTFTYTQADSVLTFGGSGRKFTVRVDADQTWIGEFQAMNATERLVVGYYPNLTGYPLNPQGALDWFGEGRACNQLTGWFAVDRVTYTCGRVSDIVLRFEQHCEGRAPALHGQIHWSATDPTKPPGPITPAPSSLWRPAPGATPTSGNYVYLVSDLGDSIGDGQTRTYTEPPSTFTFTQRGAALELNVTNGNDQWTGTFQPMVGFNQLVPGYYGNLQRWPFHNPARGGLDWWGGSGCNELFGWFAVDAVTYRNGVVQAIDLRFEQHCEYATPALRGQVHIVRP